MKLFLKNTLTPFHWILIYGFSLLLLRIIITGELYFIFLAWNLFLAAVPLWICKIIEKFHGNIGMGTVLLFAVWLLFLPNTFYVVTDLMHLQNSSGALLMLDVLLILSFALICLYLGFASLQKMNKIIIDSFHLRSLIFFNYSILILCSFGIYLGRFLRYNSWNIISNPKSLFLDCFNFLKYPMENKEVWIFTFGFGLFLISIHRLFNKTSYAIDQE
ncbi:DUF1361 domain-containing protein [Christiangramia forsetii]|uniref:Membrane protein containing DUF1361 n=1 Tax=Christiangramia forsetii (strain DSM 17595 / CGMCC 1.15422 / KT0803) TaxID=411154 RepID=A0M4H2_CHRFK|nr:DUF1361 domain-containing protein [Christiangramia forsetii]CAL67517.1 membrane protein containing DUF1361 [Christiangramia forsetii KT0803]